MCPFGQAGYTTTVNAGRASSSDFSFNVIETMFFYVYVCTSNFVVVFQNTRIIVTDELILPLANNERDQCQSGTGNDSRERHLPRHLG